MKLKFLSLLSLVTISMSAFSFTGTKMYRYDVTGYKSYGVESAASGLLVVEFKRSQPVKMHKMLWGQKKENQYNIDVVEVGERGTLEVFNGADIYLYVNTNDLTALGYDYLDSRGNRGELLSEIDPLTSKPVRVLNKEKEQEAQRRASMTDEQRSEQYLNDMGISVIR